MWMHISIILSSWGKCVFCVILFMCEYIWVRLFVSIYVGVHSMFFLFFKLVTWRIIIYNIVMGIAIHQHESAICIRVPPHPESPSHLPPHPIPLGCPRKPALDALLHASNSHWPSILHVVMHMLRCYSLKSSHPRLLPLSPKVCSLHPCLFCCPACTIVHIIFLNCTYMHE